MSTRDLPAFSSEAEEAAWWYDNRETHDAEFAQAFTEGRVGAEAAPSAWRPQNKWPW